MRFEFPLKFTTKYRSHLSKKDSIEILNNRDSKKILKGLMIEKYAREIKQNQFLIRRYTLGLNLDFIFGKSPLIIGTFENDNPVEIKVEFIPSLLSAIFHISVSLIFIISSFTMDKAAVNGVVKEADLGVKSLFFSVGIFILLFWYWLNLRPIQTSKKWLEAKLNLTEL